MRSCARPHEWMLSSASISSSRSSMILEGKTDGTLREEQDQLRLARAGSVAHLPLCFSSTNAFLSPSSDERVNSLLLRIAEMGFRIS